MYKVWIDPAGRVFRTIMSTSETKKSQQIEIGIIPNFKYSDIAKHPNTAKRTSIKLNSGETVMVTYGGFLNGKFVESCHLKCIWGSHCANHKKTSIMACIHSPNLTDQGLYVI